MQSSRNSTATKTTKSKFSPARGSIASQKSPTSKLATSPKKKVTKKKTTKKEGDQKLNAPAASDLVSQASKATSRRKSVAISISLDEPEEPKESKPIEQEQQKAPFEIASNVDSQQVSESGGPLTSSRASRASRAGRKKKDTTATTKHKAAEISFSPPKTAIQPYKPAEQAKVQEKEEITPYIEEKQQEPEEQEERQVFEYQENNIDQPFEQYEEHHEQEQEQFEAQVNEEQFEIVDAQAQQHQPELVIEDTEEQPQQYIESATNTANNSCSVSNMSSSQAAPARRSKKNRKVKVTQEPQIQQEVVIQPEPEVVKKEHHVKFAEQDQVIEQEAQPREYQIQDEQKKQEEVVEAPVVTQRRSKRSRRKTVVADDIKLKPQEPIKDEIEPVTEVQHQNQYETETVNDQVFNEPETEINQCDTDPVVQLEQDNEAKPEQLQQKIQPIEQTQIETLQEQEQIIQEESHQQVDEQAEIHRMHQSRTEDLLNSIYDSGIDQYVQHLKEEEIKQAQRPPMPQPQVKQSVSSPRKSNDKFKPVLQKNEDTKARVPSPVKTVEKKKKVSKEESKKQKESSPEKEIKKNKKRTAEVAVASQKRASVSQKQDTIPERKQSKVKEGQANQNRTSVTGKPVQKAKIVNKEPVATFSRKSNKDRAPKVNPAPESASALTSVVTLQTKQKKKVAAIDIKEDNAQDDKFFYDQKYVNNQDFVRNLLENIYEEQSFEAIKFQQMQSMKSTQETSQSQKSLMMDSSRFTKAPETHQSGSFSDYKNVILKSEMSKDDFRVESKVEDTMQFVPEKANEENAQTPLEISIHNEDSVKDESIDFEVVPAQQKEQPPFPSPKEQTMIFQQETFNQNVDNEIFTGRIDAQNTPASFELTPSPAEKILKEKSTSNKNNEIQAQQEIVQAEPEEVEEPVQVYKAFEQSLKQAEQQNQEIEADEHPQIRQVSSFEQYSARPVPQSHVSDIQLGKLENNEQKTYYKQISGQEYQNNLIRNALNNADRVRTERNNLNSMMYDLDNQINSLSNKMTQQQFMQQLQAQQQMQLLQQQQQRQKEESIFSGEVPDNISTNVYQQKLANQTAISNFHNTEYQLKVEQKQREVNEQNKTIQMLRDQIANFQHEKEQFESVNHSKIDSINQLSYTLDSRQNELINLQSEERQLCYELMQADNNLSKLDGLMKVLTRNKDTINYDIGILQQKNQHLFGQIEVRNQELAIMEERISETFNQTRDQKQYKQDLSTQIDQMRQELQRQKKITSQLQFHVMQAGQKPSHALQNTINDFVDIQSRELTSDYFKTQVPQSPAQNYSRQSSYQMPQTRPQYGGMYRDTLQSFQRNNSGIRTQGLSSTTLNYLAPPTTNYTGISSLQRSANFQTGYLAKGSTASVSSRPRMFSDDSRQPYTSNTTGYSTRQQTQNPNYGGQGSETKSYFSSEMPAAGIKSNQNSDEKVRTQRQTKPAYYHEDNVSSAAPASHQQLRVSHNIFDSNMNNHDDNSGLLQVPRNQGASQFGKKAQLKDQIIQLKDGIYHLQEDRKEYQQKMNQLPSRLKTSVNNAVSRKEQNQLREQQQRLEDKVTELTKNIVDHKEQLRVIEQHYKELNMA